MGIKQITSRFTLIPELTRATSQNSWMAMIQKWDIAAYPFNYASNVPQFEIISTGFKIGF